MVGSVVRFGGLLGTIIAFGLRAQWYWVEMVGDERTDRWPEDSPIAPGLPKRWWSVHRRFLA